MLARNHIIMKVIKMEKELPIRKRNRLENFEYDSVGAYFLTICTSNRCNYFWNNVGASIARPQSCTQYCPQEMKLSQIGKIAEDAINNIPSIYPNLKVDCFVIMPDHIHLILMVCAEENGRPMVAPTVSRVVQQLKGYVTKRIGRSIWQKSFFDHVIRNQRDYEKHIQYIYENPMRLYYDEL